MFHNLKMHNFSSYIYIFPVLNCLFQFIPFHPHHSIQKNVDSLPYFTGQFEWALSQAVAKYEPSIAHVLDVAVDSFPAAADDPRKVVYIGRVDLIYYPYFFNRN